MFRSALIKLTLLYLLIIMVISLFFSLSIYRVSTIEINNNLRRQQNSFEKFGPGRGIINDPDFLAERETLLKEAKESLTLNLLYTNLVILILGGGLSYFLARRTLIPIEEAHEAQIRFTADASHELRSPLAAMKTEIEVALRDKNISLPETKKQLQSNLEEVDKLKNLTEGLLELARDNDNTREKVNVTEFITAGIRRAKKNPKAKNIEIIEDLQANSAIWGNQENLTELITILLDNALKYSPHGKSIEVSSQVVGSQVKITVTDHGCGISENDLLHIFERFFRADLSRSKNKIEGYGLGLSIAKKIVEKHHGKIDVTSKLEEGTTFQITFPLK